jgi:hypothetical protein
MIRNPIDTIVFPNPSFKVLTISFEGKVVNTRKSDIIKMALNTFNFNFDINTINPMMLMPAATDFKRIPIIQYYVKNRCAT